MKKLFSILLIVGLVVSLTACSGLQLTKDPTPNYTKIMKLVDKYGTDQGSGIKGLQITYKDEKAPLTWTLLAGKGKEVSGAMIAAVSDEDGTVMVAVGIFKKNDTGEFYIINAVVGSKTTTTPQFANGWYDQWLYEYDTHKGEPQCQ